jgi:predicted small lipoprotein YifL
MLNTRFPRSALLVALLALTACGKKADDNAPLAFVPADTPYVLANSESLPDATIAAWAKQMQHVWPVVIGMYEKMLSDIPSGDDGSVEGVKRVVRAVLDEVKSRDTPAKWAEVGLGTKSLGAFYGVGLVPVIRVELSDADAFRAMVARIETNSGAKLGTARLGDQDLWIIDGGKVQGVIAIEGKHLVISVLPSDADETLKRSVLGLDRPAKNLADSGALAALDKAEGYRSFGSGWIDLRRIVALIDNDPGYSAFAKLVDQAPPKLDAECRAEFDAIAARAPRLVFGYTALEAKRMAFASRLDLDPQLAQSFIKLSTPPPGSAAPPAGSLYDIAMSLPVLKIKDFLIERTDAIVAAPFRCPSLALLNDHAAELKTQLSQFVPPPLSDFTGVRITIDHLDWPTDGSPDFAGQLLVGSTNPMAIVGMAQLAVPALREFKISTDGKPVPLPAGVIPNEVGFAPEVQVALSDKALAIGTGANSDLSAYLAAPTANDGQLLRATYSGKFYETIGELMTRFSAMLPEKDRANVEQQQEIYAMYARWIKHIDVRVNATAKGIETLQDVELLE